MVPVCLAASALALSACGVVGPRTEDARTGDIRSGGPHTQGAPAAAVSTPTSTGHSTPSPSATPLAAPRPLATAPAPENRPEHGEPGPGEATAYEDPLGRFTLRYGALWEVVEVPDRSGPVDWLLRIERGQPDSPLVPGARRPPNGVRFDVGIAEVGVGADLEAWMSDAIPLDSEAYSVTADGIVLAVGPDGIDALVREGQILPYYGRWREWVVPIASDPGRVFVLRAASYGADELTGMVHAKLVAASFQPSVEGD